MYLFRINAIYLKGHIITLDKTIKALYSIYLHKTQFSFDCTKYSYSVPKAFNKKLEWFYNQNQFNIPKYCTYSENNCIVKGVINFFINNDNTVKHISEEQYDKFIYDLIHYKNNISLFINNISVNDLNPDSIYRMYIKKEIPYYIFYFSFRYLKFKETNNILINDKLKEAHKIMMLFKHFDKEYVEEQFIVLQHKINLS